jgi:hypothetical protein
MSSKQSHEPPGPPVIVSPLVPRRDMNLGTIKSIDYLFLTIIDSRRWQG